MTDDLTQVGRVAFRVEGNLWVAYYADPDTMTDAIFLGSIQKAFVQDPEAKASFMALMRGGISTILNEETEWTTVPAPESERGGRA